MKIRVIVANDERHVQAEENGEWLTIKIGKAGRLKPGIYNLYVASVPVDGETYKGQILYADAQWVYQLVGSDYVKHRRQEFAAVPLVGILATLTYD